MSKLKPKRKAKRNYVKRPAQDTISCLVCLSYHGGKACPKLQWNRKKARVQRNH